MSLFLFMENKTRMNSWDHFWNVSNALSSFSKPNQKFGYPDDLVKFWENIASECSDETKILDLCTGRGALALLFSQYSVDNHKDFAIYGVDAANIDISKTATESSLIDSYKNISFLFNTNIESLPYEDNSFDLLVSQFGIEYSDIESTFRMLSKVLTVNGKSVIVCHDLNSEISQESIAGMLTINKVFESNVFLELFKVIHSSVEPSLLQHAFQARLHSLVSKLIFNSREHTWSDDILNSFENISKKSSDKASYIKLLDNLATNLEETYARLNQQVSAAKTKEQLLLAVQNSKQLNLISLEALKIDGYQFAWVLNLKKEK